jgi:hypothetical protein
VATRKRASQESPRNLKHLGIHILVEMGFLVFSNVAAKDAIDLVVGIPKMGELRIAGIRIKTSSYSEDRKGWYFSEDRAKFFIDKNSFFYVFCLKRDHEFVPTFVVISSTNFKKMSDTVRNGNYAFKISKNQVENESKWTEYLGIKAFEQIKRALEE